MPAYTPSQCVEALREILRFSPRIDNLWLHLSRECDVTLSSSGLMASYPVMRSRVTPDVLGPFKPHMEIRSLFPEQMAWLIADHYRGGLGPNTPPGFHTVILGVDVPHCGWIDVSYWLKPIAHLATRMIGKPRVTVDPHPVNRDEWVIWVAES